MNAQLSPEIDSLRAQVQRQTAEQQVTNASNDLEKAKLTLARLTGLPIDQKFTTTDAAEYRALASVTEESAVSHARDFRADLRSARARVREAEYRVRSEKAQRFPTLSLRADYGGAGVNLGAFSQVHTVAGQISMPLYTGGRIRSDIDQAQTNLARRQAEYEDLEGRIVYDVRVAWLNGEWITATGNSFAAPHMTGIVTKILGKHPGLTVFQLKTILQNLASNVLRRPGPQSSSAP